MKKDTIIFSLLIILSSVVFGQNKSTKFADTYFNNLSYVKSAKLYEKLAEKDSVASQYILERLGDSYYFNHKMEKASKWYGKLMNNYQSTTSPEYFFKYAQSLRAQAKYADSDVWMKKFNTKNVADTRGADFVEKQSELSQLTLASSRYQIKNLEKINTKYSDYGASYYQDKIIFASAKKQGKLLKRTYAWNKEPFLDFYLATPNKEGALEEITNFSEKVNSKYHESNASFSPDGQTIYFTRNNYTKGKYKTGKKGINHLKLYKASRNLAKDSSYVWGNIKELPFNSDEYSVGHPSVNSDGTRLYFTSDMPGGKGQTDIYYANINTNNTFGEVINAGATINTEGREMFPFISSENILYFSSDGHFGQGGLDIFESKISDNSFEDLKVLPAPINSKSDDFSLVLNTENTEGYFSSNREGGAGGDDIYSFTREEEIVEIVPPCMQLVSGVVKDKKFKNPLANSRLILKDNQGLILKDTLANSLGEFSFKLPCNQTFFVTASKEYYTPDSDSFITTEAQEVELDLDFTLQIVGDFSYNERNELIIKINPIYFDYNKSKIRPDASTQLDIVISVMKKYPKLEVRGSSHTDARGKASYNEKLSTRRAKSTVDYIIANGIIASKIVAKGFGETQLTNDCIDNDRHTNRVKCSKNQHQVNRRTEFVITKM
jgi:outer membrane protein OmpA-like peptidoglycan-associated protein